MSISTEMHCDACGELLFKHGAVGRVYMEKKARKEGWQIGKYHLCPKCKKKGISQLKKEGWLSSR